MIKYDISQISERRIKIIFESILHELDEIAFNDYDDWVGFGRTFFHNGLKHSAVLSIEYLFKLEGFEYTSNLKFTEEYAALELHNLSKVVDLILTTIHNETESNEVNDYLVMTTFLQNSINVLAKSNIFYVAQSISPLGKASEVSLSIMKDGYDDFGYKTSSNLTVTFPAHSENLNKSYVFSIKIIHKLSAENTKKTEDAIATTNILFSYMCDSEYSRMLDVIDIETVDYILNEISELRSNNDNVQWIVSLIKNNDDYSNGYYGVLKDSICRDNISLDEIRDFHLIKTISIMSIINNKSECILNFEIKHSWGSRFIGVIGTNGSGKSKFLVDLHNSINKPSASSKLKIDFSGFKVSRSILFQLGLFDSNYKYNNTLYHFHIFNYLEDTIVLELIRNSISSIRFKEHQSIILELWNSTIFTGKKLNNHEIMEHVLIDKYTNYMSTGQKYIFILSLSLLAKIQSNSMILIDELEVSQHPQNIQNLLLFIHKICEDFNSYAVFTTHSPYVIQNIPAELAILIKKNKMNKLNIETFGSSHDIISSSAFDITIADTLYSDLINKSTSSFDIEELYLKGYRPNLVNTILEKGDL